MCSSVPAPFFHSRHPPPSPRKQSIPDDENKTNFKLFFEYTKSNLIGNKANKKEWKKISILNWERGSFYNNAKRDKKKNRMNYENSNNQEQREYKKKQIFSSFCCCHFRLNRINLAAANLTERNRFPFTFHYYLYNVIISFFFFFLLISLL